MRQDKTKIPEDARKPRKRLALQKKTVRDLRLEGSARHIKGGRSSGTSIVVSSGG